MKKSIPVTIVMITLITFAGIIFINSNKNNMQQISKIKLSSEAFENNQPIPQKYGCDGENINPPLSINNIPNGTKSLVLIVDDPNALSGSFVHWTVWNISATISIIAEDSVPKDSVQGLNGYKNNKYDGPCPPSGTHSYIFKLYALDTVLNLEENSMKADLENAIIGHVLGQTELIGTYSK